MMLLNPSAGEIVDRLTILELKIAHKKGQAAMEWMNEHELLQKKLEVMSALTREAYVSNAVREYRESLQAVNNVLWESEDELRSYPDGIEFAWSIKTAFEIANCAKKIALFNDKRMGLVREINTLFGQKDAAQGAQKIYGVKA